MSKDNENQMPISISKYLCRLIINVKIEELYFCLWCYGLWWCILIDALSLWSSTQSAQRQNWGKLNNQKPIVHQTSPPIPEAQGLAAHCTLNVTITRLCSSPHHMSRLHNTEADILIDPSTQLTMRAMSEVHPNSRSALRLQISVFIFRQCTDQPRHRVSAWPASLCCPVHGYL